MERFPEHLICKQSALSMRIKKTSLNTHTLKGSFGSLVSVILNVTLAIFAQKLYSY